MDVTLITELLSRFAINIVVVLLIIYLFYYPKSRRRDYTFTFTLISISIFFMIYLLGGTKLKIGFALGLFAIFGIIRYRTESMPVREMTYLFMIIAISVINALNADWHALEVLCVNAIFVLSLWACESILWLKQRHLASKLVMYDRIELIVPARRAELIADLEARLGLKIVKIEVGDVDFIKEATMIKVF